MKQATRNLQTLPEWTWTGNGFPTPPPIGARVRVSLTTACSLGHGAVVGYFVAGGILGLLVHPDSAPAWYVQQNGPGTNYAVFGVEVSPEYK